MTLVNSPEWLEISQKVADLATAASHVLITGEHGVGKRHLALAIAAARNLTPVVINAADAHEVGAVKWLERASAVVAELPESAVPVVVALERLDANVLSGLATVIDSRETPALATAVRPGPRSAAHHPVDSLTVFGHRVHIPALRHRPEDVGPLAQHFDLRHGAGALTWTAEAMQVLERYVWPGNVRELELMVEGLLEQLWEAAIIEVDHLPDDLLRRVRRRPLTRLEEAEVDVMLAALTEANGNKDLAAHLIGIHRATLYRKLANFGLDGPPGS